MDATRSSGHGAESQGHNVDEVDSAAIEFENVSTTFTGEQVLDGVNLKIPPGRTTALMGEAQAGKSVLVKHLLGAEKPTEGRVLLNGESIWDMPEDQFSALSSGFGVIEGERRTHDNKLDANHSVIDNLVTPLLGAGMGEDQARDKAGKCAREWELEESVDLRPDECQRRLKIDQ